MQKIGLFGAVVATIMLSQAHAKSESASLDRVSITANSGHDYVIDETKVSRVNAGLVSDVLRDIPGVYVGGTNGQNQRIQIRGVLDHGLNITIDGAKQKGNIFHHSGNLIIDPELLKAIEVDVGAKSVTSGSGALGGSVAFRTVDAKDLLEQGQNVGAKVKVGYGSNNDEFSQSFTFYSIPVDRLDLLASVSHKGYSNGKSGNGKKIGGDDGNDLSYLLKVGYDVHDSGRLAVSHQHMRYDGKYPFRAEFGAWLAANADVKDRKFERDTTTVKYSYTPSELLNLDLSAYRTNHQKVSADGKKIVKEKWGVETFGADAKAKSRFLTGSLAHTLKYGIEFYNTESFNKPNNLRPEEVDNYSIYLEDAIGFGSSGVKLTPGVRYDRHELNTYHGSGVNVQAHKQKFNEISPAIALSYDATESITLFTSYAKVFRGPDIMQSIYASGMAGAGAISKYVADDNLKATTGENYELGARFYGRIDADSSYSFVAKYYQAEYENLIDDEIKRGSGGSHVQRMNIGGAKIDGIELLARLNIKNIRLSASYAHQDIDYTDRLKSGAGYRSSYVLGYRDQGDKYTFNAEYVLPSYGVLLGYRLMYMGGEDTASSNSDTIVSMPSYAVNDFYVTYAPASGQFKGFELNAGIYNAFNKAYTSHSQRIEQYEGERPTIDWEAGRNFKMSVAYKF
ncbi:MAG: TonB-dependent receptor domain-containing protein [Wolinella sp.]